MSIEYTQELIEAAVQQMLSPDTSKQQAAAEFIESWKTSDDSYILAFAILTHSSHVYAQFYSMLVIKACVSRKWDQLPDDFRADLRNYLCESLTHFDVKSHLFNNACDLVSLIGVFDWPERWPDFLSDILSFDVQPLIQLTLLYRFTSTITDGIFVTHTRRAKLLGVMLELSPQISAAVNAGLTMDDSIDIAYSVLDTQLKTEALHDFLPQGIVSRLINELSPQPKLHNGAVQCLTTIFIDRYDCFKIGPPYIPVLLRGFLVQYPQTESPPLMLFIEKLLFKHSAFICYLLSGMQPEIDVEGAFQSVVVQDLPQVQDDVLSILRIILLNRPDEKTMDAFWALWRCLLPHLYTPPMSELPIAEQTQQLTPLIHEALFSFLPMAVSEHAMIDTVARICWSTDLALFPQALTDYLKTQEPSVALCYAVGFAETSLSPDLFSSLFQAHIQKLLQYCDEINDPDYTNALLFCLSHSGENQINNPEYFSIFTSFALKCLSNEEESVKSEATHSLFYVARRHPELFLANNMELAIKYCNNIQQYLEKLGHDSSARMIRICSFLAQKSQTDTLFPMIIQPIYSNFMNYAQAMRTENVTKTINFLLSLIADIAHIIPSAIIAQFEEPIFGLLNSTEGSNFSLTTTELIVRAAATLVSCRPPNEALAPLTQLYFALFNNESIYYLLFETIAIVREAHPELDSFYQKIETDFIVPLVSGALVVDDCTSLFRMISAFSLNAFDMKILNDLLSFGLRHPMSIVSIAAAKCTRRVLRSFTSEESKDALIDLTHAIIPPIIVSLTDCVHTPATGPLIHLLYDLFAKNSEFDPTASRISEDFLSNLSIFCIEPSEGIFSKVLESLVLCVGEERQFRHVVFDLLVSLRSATPCDLATFDVFIGPPIWMSADLSSMFMSVVQRIEKQQADEDFAIQRLKDLSID